MHRFLILALFLTPAAVHAGEKPGSLSGTVRFLGTVPPAQRITTTDGGLILHRDLVVDAKTKGLRDVVVILHGVSSAAPTLPTGKTIIDQRDMIFQPRVVAVLEGQTVRFENNDLCNHAVQANSVEPANAFNVLTPQGNPFETKFKAQKRPVVIGCPIHPWMRAWVYVLPHPYVAVSDAAGRFKIEQIPPGTYTLEALHPDTNRRETRKLTIHPGQATALTIGWPK